MRIKWIGPWLARPGFRLVLLWVAPLAFLALFYFYPLGKIIDLSFSREENGFSGAIQTLLASRTIHQILWFTVWQAILSTLLTLLIGLPGAFLLARFQFRGKSLLLALSGIPFVLPTLVVAAAFNALLGPQGWINLALMDLLNLSQPPLQLTNTIYAILLAHIFYNTTIILRMVGDFWSRLDPRLTQAARTLGANRWQAFKNISLPLLTPAIAAAALLVFIFDFTSFGVILVLGGPRFATLEVEIYYQTVSLFNLPLAAVLALLQLVCTLGITIVYTRLTARFTQPMRQHSLQYTQRRVVSWRDRFFTVIIVSLLILLLITPLVALAVRSITSMETSRFQSYSLPLRITLAYYSELSMNRQSSSFYVPPTTALAISLGYALATVVLAIGLGFPAAWALARNDQNQFNRMLDPILMLPLGTSAVTLGLGFIVALNRPPLDLRASPWLVPIAHTLVAFPFVIRSLTPALRSIQPRLRHAAAMLGAPPGVVFRNIDLPLVGRALLVAATFAFAISLGEFGATAMIARPEYPTVPLVIYRYLSSPGALNYGQALALSTILMVVCAAGILIIEKFRISGIGEF